MKTNYRLSPARATSKSKTLFRILPKSFLPFSHRKSQKQSWFGIQRLAKN